MLEMGFYCGLSMLYPYQPIYCPTDNCLGDCRGVYIYTSKSAPLPKNEKVCVGYDNNNSIGYRWQPRESNIVFPSASEPKLCFWEDRNK